MNIVPSFGHVRRGFTLIELLVVIAIIGILSSVVLASLNTARSKGTDAKIQSEIRSIQVNAEIYYDNNGNVYGSSSTVSTSCRANVFAFASNPNIYQIITDLMSAHGTADPVCSSSSAGYAISHQLLSPTTNTFFCADSSGKVATSTTAHSTSGVVCN